MATPQPRSVQRSFRLSASTSGLLDELADASGVPRNALADRLLGEALRTERHPYIRFRTVGGERREPFVVGTRLLVRQIMSTLHGHRGDVGESAEYFSVPEHVVRAACEYYADFKDEIDADAERAERFEADERARWERQQAAIA